MSSHSGKAVFIVAVSRDFIARHFLFGGDWGPENQIHSHHYRVEVQLEGSELDQHGYLVDIVDIEQALEAQVAYYRDKVLNELPEFAGLNPSIERLARFFSDALCERLLSTPLTAVAVKIWENEIAWTSFRRELR
jgi:6-pyruvoyltetrahydropterin/6-carboxytetrahydropterin synthase